MKVNLKKLTVDSVANATLGASGSLIIKGIVIHGMEAHFPDKLQFVYFCCISKRRSYSLLLQNLMISKKRRILLNSHSLVGKAVVWTRDIIVPIITIPGNSKHNFICWLQVLKDVDNSFFTCTLNYVFVYFDQGIISF